MSLAATPLYCTVVVYPTPISCERRRSQPGTLLSCEAGPKQDEEDELEAEDGEDEEEEEEEDEMPSFIVLDCSKVTNVSYQAMVSPFQLDTRLWETLCLGVLWE